MRRRRRARHGAGEARGELRPGAEPGLGDAHPGDPAGRRQARHLSAAARAAEGHERGEGGEGVIKTRNKENRDKVRQKDVEEDGEKTVMCRGDTSAGGFKMRSVVSGSFRVCGRRLTNELPCRTDARF